ncbi:MAG TPA: EpsI family protein [Pyrinomonadaceae bacterium]|nr:EpsI family protein [Pyrinomonadaceae bacterium]
MIDIRTNTLRFWILLATLLLGGGIINVWERAGEARVSRRPLKDFPAQLGAWRQVGGDFRFDEETEKVLRADDYISRNFESPDGRVASFYVGYYATQRNGATYHSPLNCLPGSGWTMSDGARITITPADGGAQFEANRYVVENGKDRALMVYWYQGRGRATASEYWGKIYTVMDSVRWRRSDGAMVRLMVPLGNSEEEAQKAAVELASQAASQLPAFVPN